jgi:hypothetical protein
MAHKYTLSRNIIKDVLSWIPSEHKIKITEPITLEQATAIFTKRPSGIDPERTLKVFDMYYGLSDGVFRTREYIGKQYDRGDEWVSKQRNKVLRAIATNLIYRNDN